LKFVAVQFFVLSVLVPFLLSIAWNSIIPGILVRYVMFRLENTFGDRIDDSQQKPRMDDLPNHETQVPSGFESI